MHAQVALTKQLQFATSLWGEELFAKLPAVAFPETTRRRTKLLPPLTTELPCLARRIKSYWCREEGQKETPTSSRGRRTRRNSLFTSVTFSLMLWRRLCDQKSHEKADRLDSHIFLLFLTLHLLFYLSSEPKREIGKNEKERRRMRMKRENHTEGISFRH